jgi:hypothetical protein
MKDVAVFFVIPLEERHGKGDPRGNVLARFLATSCRVARSSTKRGTAQREAVCASTGEVAGNLAIPLAFHHRLLDKI